MQKIYIVLFFLLVSFYSSKAQSDKKKVVIGSIGVNKYIGMGGIGGSSSDEVRENLKTLTSDPEFNLAPILESFKTQFIDEFSKQLPFEISPEEEVLTNPGYIAFKSEATERNYITTSPRYVYFSSKSDAKALSQIFPDQDGVMFIYLTYEFAPKIAIAGMGTAGMKAFVSIELYNKQGKKVFSITESAKSKKSIPLVDGVPVIKGEKVLPLCEDSTKELLKDLVGRIPKIAKKVDAKL